MNSDTLQGRWTELKGNVREKWGKLTDDDVDQIAGKYEQLVGKLQTAYGKSKDAARKEADEWLAELDRKTGSVKSTARAAKP